MPASRRESENAVGSYDVDVVVVIAVVADSMTSLSSAAARVEIFRHLFLLLLLLLAREEKDDDDDDDDDDAQKWHSRRLRVVFLIGGATAARADIARINLYCIKSGGKFSPTYLKTLIKNRKCASRRPRSRRRLSI
jgi:hypothetical protein